MTPKLKLFSSGALQVFFVAMNVTFLAKEMIIPAALSSFALSYCWSWNVRSVAFGDHLDRFIYAGGAATGGVIGYYCSHFMLHFL